MATNSVLNQGLAPQFVSAETIRTLTPVLQPITAIAVTDMGSYLSRIGSTIHTRLAAPFTANTYDPAVGFVAQAATATDIAVTLTNLTYVDVGFTDQEQNSISLESLKRVFLNPLVSAVSKTLFDSILNSAVSSTYSTAAYSGAKSAFNRASVANISTSLTKANILYDERAALMSPDAFGQLIQDPTVAQYLSYGDTSIIKENGSEGYLGKLHGIKIYEANTFPTSGTAFTEGLNGIVGSKEGWVIATRVTNAPTTGGGVQEIIVEPMSQFSLAFRQYYLWNEGRMHLNMSFINGQATGNPAAAQRIAFTS